MKKIILTLALCLSSLSGLTISAVPVKAASAKITKNSVLDTQVGPWLQANDCSGQVQSVNEILAETETLLESTRDELSECDSLLESTQNLLLDAPSIIESAQELMFDPSVPNASSIDDIASRLALITPYDGVNVTEPLLDQINVGLIPYLQAALVKLGELSPIKQIAVGGSHTVVLLKSGTAWATGDNSNGQLGIGSFGGIFTTLQPMTTNNSSIIAISAGLNHTVVLKGDGTVYATGLNSNGQLGDNTNVSKNVLTLMAAPNNSLILAIAAGGNHTVVLKSDGIVYATGLNSNGQLGDETLVNKNSLTAMTTNNSLIAAIAAGGNHTVVLKSDGIVYATGLNSNGQLGDGTLDQKDVLTLMATATNSNIAAIAAGGSHTAVLKSNGTVYATGDNTYGELGDDTGVPGTNRNTLTLMAATTNSNISFVVTGSGYTVVLKSNGKAYATGLNSNGELGDGTNVSKNILTEMITANSNIIAIAAGASDSLNGGHTIVLKSNGTGWGTGLNTSGQLGDGTLINKNVLTEMAPFLS